MFFRYIVDVGTVLDQKINCLGLNLFLAGIFQQQGLLTAVYGIEIHTLGNQQCKMFQRIGLGGGERNIFILVVQFVYIST